MVEEPLVVTVEVDAGEEPISGRVQAGSGPARAFVGWLQLISGLQESVDGYRGRGPVGTEGRE